MWQVANFGKWLGEGLTLPQIVFRDPDWFFWALQENAFKGPLALEAAEIGRKAQRIKINKPDPGEWEIEHLIGIDGKYATFSVVPHSQPLHVGSSRPIRAKHLDFSLPRRVAPYDKLGGRHLLGGFKFHWFGSASARLTKQRCETFFDNPANFV